MKRLLLTLLFCLLVFVHVAEAKVLVYNPGSSDLNGFAPYIRYWQLTWPLSGTDSSYTSLLSDSITTDEDTTNAFMVAGLLPWSNSLDSTTVAAFVFRCVADTIIDTLAWCLDYSYDGSAWVAGGKYTAILTLADRDDGAIDTTLYQAVKTNPAVRNGGQVLAPYWRLRVQSQSHLEYPSGVVGVMQEKKLKKFYAYFYAGARPR